MLTLREAAEILRVSKRALLKIVQQKEVPAFKVGGQWRIRECQFKRWVEGKENTAWGRAVASGGDETPEGHIKNGLPD